MHISNSPKCAAFLPRGRFFIEVFKNWPFSDTRFDVDDQGLVINDLDWPRKPVVYPGYQHFRFISACRGEAKYFTNTIISVCALTTCWRYPLKLEPLQLRIVITIPRDSELNVFIGIFICVHDRLICTKHTPQLLETRGVGIAQWSSCQLLINYDLL